jgi:hypothetical protein
MKTLPNRTTQSPAEDAKDNPKPKQTNPQGYDTPKRSDRTTLPNHFMHEHDMVQSRLGGKAREISMGPHGGGLVPSNPFASLAQAGFLHEHPEKLGKAGLAEWDAASKGRHLPEHVKK